MPPETIASSAEDGFDIALRRRGDVTELIVNGMFAMDSAEVASELSLADVVPADARTVLVGGLGLGFTAARLLDRTAAHITVVELSDALVRWARGRVTDQLGRVAHDGRITLVTGGIDDHLTLAEPVDALLLDVDNGPDFLIHDANATLYRGAALARAAALVRPGGVLAIWSERRSPELHDALSVLGGTADAVIVPVVRGRHSIDYAIHTWRP